MRTSGKAVQKTDIFHTNSARYAHLELHCMILHNRTYAHIHCVPPSTTHLASRFLFLFLFFRFPAPHCLRSALCAGAGDRRSSSMRSNLRSLDNAARDRIWLGIFKHFFFKFRCARHSQELGFGYINTCRYDTFPWQRELIRCYDRFACM